MTGTRDERLTAFEAACWHLERRGQPLHSASLYVLDGPLDFARTVREVERCLGGMPRWRQRVVEVPFDLAAPLWLAARGFDVRGHVVHHLLRAPADADRLARLVSRLFAQPLERRRPLWEVHQIDGCPGGRSALLVKVHHCLLGGIHGSELERCLFEGRAKRGGDSPSRRPGIPGVQELRPPSPIVRLADAVFETAATTVGSLGRLLVEPSAVAASVRDRAVALADLVRLAASGAPASPLNGHVSTLRGLAWTVLSAREIAGVTSRLGGATGDVVLAVIAGALREWLARRGHPVDRLELRALCPSGVRGPRGKRLSIVAMPLPVGIGDPLERLRQVRAMREGLERQDAARRTARGLALLAEVPQPLQRPLAWLQVRALPVNTICTTTSVSHVRLHFQDRVVEQVVPLVPLAQGVGLAFGVLEYADDVAIGVTFDPALLRDADALGPQIESAFRELVGAAERAPRETRAGSGSG